MTPTNKITFTTFIFLLYHVFYYRHHVMIKRIFFFFIFFATFNTSWSKEKKNHLVTTFTTPWPKVKTFFFFISHCVHYTMIKRKTFFFILTPRSIRHGHRKRNLIFNAPLLWLRYDHEKNIILFHYYVHYGNIVLHDLTSTYFTH